MIKKILKGLSDGQIERRARKNKKNPIKMNWDFIDKEILFYLPNKEETPGSLNMHLRAFGFREPINSEYCYKFVDKSDVVLDIGANLGMFTLLCMNAKKIVAIEPLKDAIPIIIKNVDVNGLSNKCQVINKAVSKSSGEVLLEVSEARNLSRVVKKGQNTDKVEAVSLRDAVKTYGSNMLRMDVEGHEYDILYKRIPKKVNKISLEFHSDILGENKIKKLLAYFEEEGFRVRYLIEDIHFRIYPFYRLIKNLGLLSLFSYVIKDLSPKDCYPYLMKRWGPKVMMVDGGSIGGKHMFLER